MLTSSLNALAPSTLVETGSVVVPPLLLLLLLVVVVVLLRFLCFFRASFSAWASASEVVMNLESG